MEDRLRNIVLKGNFDFDYTVPGDLSYSELTVAHVETETPTAKSFVLRVPEDISQSFHFEPGQHLVVKFNLAGETLVRAYSISGGDLDSCIFTVDRVDDGKVSNHLCDSISEGDTILVAPPVGAFVLQRIDRPMVFIAAGSGITPIYPMLVKALSESTAKLKLFYANHARQSTIFLEKLTRLQEEHPDQLDVYFHYISEDEALSLHTFKSVLYREASSDFYLCGSGYFLALAEEALRELHVPPGNIFNEHFASPPDLCELETKVGQAGEVEQTDQFKVHIKLDGKSHEIQCGLDQTILDAALDSGVTPPFLCQSGYCATCIAKVTEGEVRMVKNTCLTDELVEEGWVATCQSLCTQGPVTVEYPE